MERIQAPFVGGELYFDDLERAKRFYIGTMGLEVSDEEVGFLSLHHLVSSSSSLVLANL